jgi:integrase
MSITPRTLKNGATVYDVCLDLARKPDGGRNQERRTFKTLKEAKAHETRRKAEVQAGTAVQRVRTTFGDYARGWLADVAAIRCEETTLRQYTFVVERRLLPDLERLPIADLTTPRLQRLVADLARRPSRRGGTLSRRSVEEAYRLLHMVLATAAEQRLLPRNPADGVQLPRLERAPRKAAWSAEEAAAFHAVAGRDAYEPLWTLALFTGMRRAELLGLRWADIDFAAGTATVRQTRAKAGGAAVTKGPKNRTSGRAVPLAPDALALLAAHRQRQALHVEECLDAYADNDLVCCNWFGEPWYPDTASRRFRRLVEQAGVRPVNLHYTRHTFASLALARGESLAAVSEVLGHADRETTLRIYQSVEQRAHRAVAATVAEAIMSHGAGNVTSDVTNKEEQTKNATATGGVPLGQLARPEGLEPPAFRSGIRLPACVVSFRSAPEATAVHGADGDIQEKTDAQRCS